MTKEEKRISNQKYYQSHKNELRVYARKYNEEHQTERRKYGKKRYEEHKEKLKAWMKKYYASLCLEKRDQKLATMKQYYLGHKKEKKIYAQQINNATPWLSHYYAAKKRCSNPNQRNYKWYGGKGIRMLLTRDEIDALYERDGANKMELPSIDRVDSDGNYDFDNCRFIELSENIRRSR